MLPLDLLYAFSGIEAEIVQHSQRVEILPSLILPIASYAHLLALKILSEDDGDRIRDRADVQKLVALATPKDLLLAKEGLRLIMARGFSRGKDLLADFDTDLRRYRPE